MEVRVVPCGYLKVQATEMVKPWTKEEIRSRYQVDKDGNMRLAMNALLVEEGDSKVLIDPGTADFLPARLKREYGFELPLTLEEVLGNMHVDPESITDVLFTHLHFDHGSGAFKRVPGNIVKRFPHARYHVLKAHYQYAQRPEQVEAGSFSTVLLRRLDRIYWLEDWSRGWITFEVFHGHTRSMVVPVIHSAEERVYFMSDLLPLEIFLHAETWCGYDLDPELQRREKAQFLKELRPGSRLVFFHDTLKESVIYS